MNIETIAALEKIKISEIKSTMDQIKSTYDELAIIKNKITNLYSELDQKVSLVSRMYDGSSTVTVVGSGVIEAIASNSSISILTGLNTLFSRECADGDQLKIGSEIVTVQSHDTDHPDTIITVTPALIGSYTNTFYSIIKQATKEVLTGDFDFGTLNNNVFNGNIIQGSTLQHYGRMTQPNDVVNLKYVQNALSPILVRAQNSIKRDGDTIQAPSGRTYQYNFGRTKTTFDDSTELNYTGLMSSDDNVINVKKLTDTLTASNLAMRSFIHYYNSGTTAINLAQAPLKELNFLEEYFTTSGSGLRCIKPCMVIVVANFNGYTSAAVDQSIQVALSIRQDSSILNYSNTQSWSSSASNNKNQEEISTSVFAISSFNQGSILTVPLGVTGSNLIDCHNSVSIMAFGI